MKEFIFSTIWLIFMALICSGYIWGNFAEKAYDFRTKLRKLVWMPRKLDDEARAIKLTKRLAFIILIFSILIYIAGMISLLLRNAST